MNGRRGSAAGMLFAIAFVVSSPVAFGQQVASEEVTDEVTSQAWSDGHSWAHSGLFVDAVSAVVVEEVELVLTVDGNLYRRVMGGVWESVSLGSLSLQLQMDDEQLLLDVESAIEDLDITVQFEDSEKDTDSVEDAAPELSGDDLGEVLESGLLDVNDRSLAVQHKGYLWGAADGTRTAYASIYSGTWRSEDAGRTWNAIELPLTTVFYDDPTTRTLFAGTIDGIWRSQDKGRSWSTSDSGELSGIVIHDLAGDGGQVVAATSAGLWRFSDSQWVELSADGVSVSNLISLAVDPNWEGGLWLCTAESVLRSDDGGETFFSLGSHPLTGTRAVTAGQMPGQVLASGSDGVWESVDGGLRWHALTNGLPTASIAELRGGIRPYVATDLGMFELTNRPLVALPNPSVAVEEGLTIHEVIGLALRRTGMSIEPALVQRGVRMASRMPLLQINGSYSPDAAVYADYDGFYSTRDEKDLWTVSGALCFGACGTSVAYTSYADVGSSEMDLTVINGEVYLADGDVSSMAPAAANVVQRLSAYRVNLTETISELYYSRSRLMSHTDRIVTASLLERVNHDLHVQEVGARLDIFTEGRFTSSLHPDSQMEP